MKLREEKTSIIIQVIILVFVVFSSIMTQICDSKINKYNNEIDKRELECAQYLEKINYFQSRAENLSIKKLLSGMRTESGLTLSFENNIKGQSWVADEYSELEEAYQHKKIDTNQYLEKNISLDIKNCGIFAKKLKEVVEAIDFERENHPKLFKFDVFSVKSLFIVMQMLGVLGACIFFLRLASKISGRISE